MRNQPLQFSILLINIFDWVFLVSSFILISLFSSQLFGDTDVFQQYGIPVNPTDTTTSATVPGIANKSANKTENQISGSELISYQPTATPIDFTEFLNIDDEQPLMTGNGEGIGECVLDDTTNGNNCAHVWCRMNFHFSEQNPAAPSTPSTPQNNDIYESGDLATPYIKRESFAFPK